MLRIVLRTLSNDKDVSIKLLRSKVASYLYGCLGWEYEYHIFHSYLFINTDFGISKSLVFLSVLRDICRRSDDWIIDTVEYDASL